MLSCGIGRYVSRLAVLAKAIAAQLADIAPDGAALAAEIAQFIVAARR